LAERERTAAKEAADVVEAEKVLDEAKAAHAFGMSTKAIQQAEEALVKEKAEAVEAAEAVAEEMVLAADAKDKLAKAAAAAESKAAAAAAAESKAPAPAHAPVAEKPKKKKKGALRKLVFPVAVVALLLWAWRFYRTKRLPPPPAAVLAP
jgi:hypothetical protein